MSEGHWAFAARAWHPSLGEEAAGGKLLIDRWRLRFESETVPLEIPLNKVLIEMGDKSEGGRICFCDPDQPDWVIDTYDPRILRCPPLQHQSHTRRQIQEFQSQGELQRRLIVTFGFLAVLALIAVIGSMLTSLMVRSLVAKIPPQWEQDLGDAAMGELRKEVTFLQDTKLLAKLDRGVAPLVDALPKGQFQYQFYLIQEPLPNAFALPGGHVIVTTGLLDLSDRPEELAGVVAHEIAHVTQKHVFRKIVSSLGPYLIVRLFCGNGSGVLGLLGDSSELLVSQSFSQEYELEADAVGWQYLVDARINPRGMIDILTKLEGVQASMKGMDAPIRAFSSHPATDKRIRRLEAKWKKLKNKSDFVPLDKTSAR